MAQGDVKFIRVRGRVVPIRQKKEKKPTTVPLATAGAVTGATVAAVGTAKVVRTFKAVGFKLARPAVLLGSLVGIGASAGAGAAVGSTFGIASRNPETRKRALLGLGGVAATIGGVFAAKKLGVKALLHGRQWPRETFTMTTEKSTEAAIRKTRSTLGRIGAPRDTPIVAAPGLTPLASPLERTMQIGSTGRIELLHEASHIKSFQRKTVADLHAMLTVTSNIGKIVPEIHAETIALRSLKTWRQKKAYIRGRWKGGFNTYVAVAAGEGALIGAGAYNVKKEWER